MGAACLGAALAAIESAASSTKNIAPGDAPTSSATPCRRSGPGRDRICRVIDEEHRAQGRSYVERDTVVGAALAAIESAASSTKNIAPGGAPTSSATPCGRSGPGRDGIRRVIDEEHRAQRRAHVGRDTVS